MLHCSRLFFFFSSRRRHTRLQGDWSSDVCSSDLVLDDGLISRQTADRVRGVLAPKIAGAINLHQLTRGRTLNFFVSFSSVAAISGGVGQGSYAAANTFLDALAEYRR